MKAEPVDLKRSVAPNSLRATSAVLCAQDARATTAKHGSEIAQIVITQL